MRTRKGAINRLGAIAERTKGLDVKTTVEGANNLLNQMSPTSQEGWIENVYCLYATYVETRDDLIYLVHRAQEAA